MIEQNILLEQKFFIFFFTKNMKYLFKMGEIKFLEKLKRKKEKMIENFGH